MISENDNTSVSKVVLLWQHLLSSSIEGTPRHKSTICIGKALRIVIAILLSKLLHHTVNLLCLRAARKIDLDKCSATDIVLLS